MNINQRLELYKNYVTNRFKM